MRAGSWLGILAAAHDADRAATAGNAVLFFLTITALLVLFLVVVVLLTISFRRRHARQDASRRPAEPAPDAWREAGQRAEPYPTADAEDNRS